MSFTAYTESEFTQFWINSYQAGTGTQTNLKVGSIALALAQSNAKASMVLQWIASATLQFARATTCTGADLDSWMAQFNFPRKQATSAQGDVLFSAPQVVTQALYIPLGAVIATGDSLIQYEVIADLTNNNYNSAIQQYVLAPGNQSVSVTVAAVVPGSNQSVQAGFLNQIITPIFGFNQSNGVINPEPILTGDDAESDTNYLIRFQQWINSLSKGTEDAIQSALQAITGVVKVSLFENVQAVGNPPTSIISNDQSRGNFIALIDDGSGNPPQSLKDEAYAALFGNVRAYTISYQVYGPGIVTPNIVIPVKLGPLGTEGADFPIIQAAVLNFVNSQPIGIPLENGILYAQQIADIAANASPNVITTQLGFPTFNGIYEDFVIQPYQEILLAPANVSIVAATT